ncbi:hypothetical protein ACOSQ2_016821 [Xanthoceras sorbifolium]
MSPASSSSSRWCPTPEQLMILEEMYRSGIRTPNASQIQHITAHLSFFGKIEGKNVFYWFQNHKARERQKLRRKLGKQVLIQQQHQQQLYYPHQYTHQPNHNLLHYFDSPASPSFPQLSSFNSAKFLPLQGGGGGCENATTQMMNYTWKQLDMPISEKIETEKSLIPGMYGRDWMMMMADVVVPPPPARPPLKTLELFPITATNLKEECNPTSTYN